uniref:Aquaporin-7-like n=1 Tax=Sinocyclocheilus rhinocerous TaxID=307959 RepID=A0A673IL76_9TELE
QLPCFCVIMLYTRVYFPIIAASMNYQTDSVFEFQVFGLGTVAQVVTGNGVFGEYFSINVGFGLSVAMGVHVGGKVSGAHMNAAVSFTMCVFGRLRWKIKYSSSSGVSSLTSVLCFIDAIHHYCGGNFTVSGPKATAGIFATYPAPYISIYTGFFDQVLGTGMLLLCLMALADQRNQPVVPGVEPVGVGLLVLLIGVSLGSNSGYAINPTRDLGPRVFTLMAGWGMEKILILNIVFIFHYITVFTLFFLQKEISTGEHKRLQIYVYIYIYI